MACQLCTLALCTLFLLLLSVTGLEQHLGETFLCWDRGTQGPLCALSWCSPSSCWAVTFRGFLHRLQKSETQLWLCCVICQLQICIGIQPGISINIFMWVSADVIGIWAPQIVRGDGGVIQPTSRGFRWVNQGVCHNFGAHEVSSLFSKLSYSLGYIVCIA